MTDRRALIGEANRAIATARAETRYWRTRALRAMPVQERARAEAALLARTERDLNDLIGVLAQLLNDHNRAARTIP